MFDFHNESYLTEIGRWIIEKPENSKSLLESKSQSILHKIQK